MSDYNIGILILQELLMFNNKVFKKMLHLDISIPYDLFIQTDKQVRESVEKGGAFVDALRRGRVVYEWEKCWRMKDDSLSRKQFDC